jgi:hypothetical protein
MKLNFGNIFEKFLKMVCMVTRIFYRQRIVHSFLEHQKKYIFSEIFIQIGQGQHSRIYRSISFLHLTDFKFAIFVD